MATPRLKPAKPVDKVAYEPVMIALSEARALAWFLGQLGDEESTVRYYIEDSACDQAKDVIPLVHQAVADRLRQAHDTIEREYRKLGTNLPAKDFAKAEVERLLRPTEEPKDGA